VTGRRSSDTRKSGVNRQSVDLAEFDELFRSRAVSIAQPDIRHSSAYGRRRRSPPWRRRPASASRRTIRSGRFCQVPTAPGLGIEVDQAECARHPFGPEAPHAVNAVLDNGAIVDR
jgi:L-alanine-DL-glutamate epimerase-like enolase superfamily enzyme